MDNEEQERASALPDENDEELWRELNQKVWLLVREAAVSAFGEDQLSDSPGGADEAAKTVPVKDSRKKECLSFVRCKEITGTPASLTDGEKTHLENCGYCERRINAFSKLAAPQTLEATTPATLHTTRTLRRVKVGLIEQLSAFFSRPLTAGLSFAVLVLLVGAVGFFVFLSAPEVADLPTPAREPSVTNENRGEDKVSTPDAGNSTAGVTSPGKPPTESSSNPNRPKKMGGESKTPNEGMQTSASQVESSSSPLDLRGIPTAIHGFVKAVRAYPEIPVPADVKRLFGLPRVRRAGDEPQLLSPNRQVIVEDQPTFRWANRTGASFKIIVRDKGKEPVAHGEQLTGHSWVIPEKLPAGIYYWEIYVFDKDGTEIAKTQMEAIFKVVDKAEVERVKSENESHLDKASYFINVGLLNDAESELEAELKKNPRSRKARNILRQVRSWQRQLRST